MEDPYTRHGRSLMSVNDTNQLKNAYIGYHSPWNTKEQREHFWNEIKRLTCKYSEKD